MNGLRVTDAETMEVAEMVLNKINKGLVSMMEKVGLKAVGISGKDGSVLQVDKKLAGGKDIGFVGEVRHVDATLWRRCWTMILCGLCPDSFGSMSFIPTISMQMMRPAIATAVKAAKLAFLTDIEGVYRDPLDRTSLISELTIPEAKEFLKSGNVGGGMLPKLQNCASGN